VKNSKCRARYRFVCLQLAVSAWAFGCGSDGAGERADRSERTDAISESTETAVRDLAAQILPEIQTLSALPARRPLSIALRTREELESYLTAQLAQQLPPAKLRALERTYVRFGLIPEDLELDVLLRSLLLEQVVGYYDPARDTLYVIAGIDPAFVEPVLAHEMVHALQDQYKDLDSLMSANRELNDRATAAQAALEGHATLVMLEWQLARLTGGTVGLESLPSISSLPEEALLEAAGLEMPTLASAPRVIRESLIFPYVGGLEFLRARWRAEGGVRFAPLGEEMPVSSEQVLHPNRAFGSMRDDPVELEFSPLPSNGWREIHSGDLGELETRIWLRESLNDPLRASRCAEGWNGDRYRLIEAPQGEILVWATAWDSQTDADEFAAAARSIGTTRYGASSGRTQETVRRTVKGVPFVIVVDRPTTVDLSRIDSGVSVAGPVQP
jgi:hypothetical protein